MPHFMTYVILALFPLGTVAWVFQYYSMKRRTVANYPGASPELFEQWKAATMQVASRAAFLWGAATAVNLLLYAAEIGVAGPGLLFLVIQFFVVREPAGEAKRLAGEIGLTTKAVKYVKHPRVCPECGGYPGESGRFCPQCGAALGEKAASLQL